MNLQSDPNRWAHILTENRAEVLKSLDGFLTWATKVREVLAAGDEETLATLLRQAHLARKRFTG